MDSVRKFNKVVREKLGEVIDREIEGDDMRKRMFKNNVFYYKNKGNKVFKSYGGGVYEKVWGIVLEELGLGELGWEMFEGSSWRGDGSVWGIVCKKSCNLNV